MRLILDAGGTATNSIPKMCELVDLCKEVKAELKFQLFTNSTVNTPLNRRMYKEIAEYAEDEGVLMFASVWDREAIELIEETGGKSIKIAYSQRNNWDIINAALRTGLEVIRSSGWMDQYDMHFTNLYCHAINDIPQYPVIDMLNFDGIFELFQGFSDHSLGIKQTIKAIEAGAQIIEKHVCPSQPVTSEDSKFAIYPPQVRALHEYITSRTSRGHGSSLL
jgi:sialic acid synthase